MPALGNFTDEQEQRSNAPGLAQDTREYPLQSNEYQHGIHGKNKPNGGGVSAGGVAAADGESGGNSKYNNGPQCEYSDGWMINPINCSHWLSAQKGPRMQRGLLFFQVLERWLII